MARFIRPYKVRFEDCDSAGIVFYPQYVLMAQRVFEDWFGEGLGIPLGRLHHQMKMGFPIVNLQVDFKRPSRMEDVLEWSLEVRRLGAKSLTLDIAAGCAGEERVAVKLTVVCSDLVADGLASREIPADFRAAMEKFMAPDRLKLAGPLVP
jgi:4-hydroxybenzoyl-CoA thioesterase